MAIIGIDFAYIIVQNTETAYIVLCTRFTNKFRKKNLGIKIKPKVNHKVQITNMQNYEEGDNHKSTET